MSVDVLICVNSAYNMPEDNVDVNIISSQDGSFLPK